VLVGGTVGVVDVTVVLVTGVVVSGGVVVTVEVSGVVVGIAVGAEALGGGVETVVVVTGGIKVIVGWVVGAGKKVVSDAGGREVRETAVVVAGEGHAASDRSNMHVSPKPTLTPVFDINGIIALSKVSQPIANFC